MTANLELKRFYIGADMNESTLGILTENREIIAYTLELPWLNNARNISCIPPGKYVCAPYSSEKFAKCFSINSVNDREGILIHAGNTRKDTSGCVLIGNQLGKLAGDEAVLNSRSKLDEMLQRYPDGFLLHIWQAY